MSDIKKETLEEIREVFKEIPEIKAWPKDVRKIMEESPLWRRIKRK